MSGGPLSILITGADGFVGRWLIAALRERSPRAQIVGTGLTARRVDGTRLIALDLRDADQIDVVIAAERPDIVVHLAAVSTVADANRDAKVALDVNLLGTMRLAEALLTHAPDARFLYISSSDVYGATFARWPAALDEDAPLAPTNSYAASKAAADLLVGQMSISEGLRAIRLRPFNHTGPGQDVRFALPSFAQQIAQMEVGSKPPVISVGNLEGFREFIDVRDIVRAYVDAIYTDKDVYDGRILNLSNGRPIKVREALDKLISLARIGIDVKIDPARYRPEQVRFVGGDAQRALSTLGWRPKIPFEDTLLGVLNAQRSAVDDGPD